MTAGKKSTPARTHVKGKAREEKRGGGGGASVFFLERVVRFSFPAFVKEARGTLSLPVVASSSFFPLHSLPLAQRSVSASILALRTSSLRDRIIAERAGTESPPQRQGRTRTTRSPVPRPRLMERTFPLRYPCAPLALAVLRCSPRHRVVLLRIVKVPYGADEERLLR